MTKNKFVARREREEQQATLVRNIAIVVVLSVVLLIGYGYLDQTVLQTQKAVATVNDEKISISQFQARVRLERKSLINQYIQYAQMGQQFGMDVAAQIQPIEAHLSQPASVGQNVLDTMTNELVYKEEAIKRGITVSEEDIEKELEAFLGYFPDGTPTAAPTTEPFVAEEYPTLTDEQMEIVTVTPIPTEAPTSTPEPTAVPTEEEEVEPTSEAIPTVPPIPTLTATPYTAEGYAAEYQEILTLYTETGLTEEDFRFLFESQLYYEALYEILTEDVENTGEEVWARHILVPDAVTAALVLERLGSGEDFGTLAVEFSADPSAASNQGDLGWFSRGAMVPEFEEAAFTLEEIGEVSEAIESQFGFHIIQLLGREERPLDANALQRAKDLIFQEWLLETKESYTIAIFDIWQTNVPTDPDLEETLTELFGAPQPAAQ
ncbi:MAG: hypothetical protein HN392_05825 [Anaerolineae bacterium]|jgi:peptidyl-prolyl cis-trans isomerase D|nr:hypothetical protein [Anaerolineae bacterium]MBT7074049.1 hypothetical protein [Anaerolineae bacterium]